MCYAASCNPLCGQCRPKRIVQITCPHCGAPNEITREEFLNLFQLPHKVSLLERKMLERGEIPEPVCISCGTDLREAYAAAAPPAPCHVSRIICGFPCGRRNEPNRDDAPPCPTMVPLGRLDEAKGHEDL